jgi:methylated-DNA-[protein]-cysteine S-methyltransferase
MALKIGAGRFGLWYVQVHWSENTVYRIRFSRTGEEAAIPPSIRMYLSGKTRDIEMESVATQGMSTFAQIYREVKRVPYAKTATYGEIARTVGTGPRVVGIAMARNPTPLVIPCHRIVGSRSLGGFTPDLTLKSALLDLERGYEE